MSSLPPSERSAAGRHGQLSRMYNRFARRDPELYPLFAIMAATGGLVAYFLARKSNNVDPAKQFTNLSNPWEPHADKISTPANGSRVQEWKYAYRTAKGETVVTPSAIKTTDAQDSGAKG